MTGIDSNLEALADKEYQQDEALLNLYQVCIEGLKYERKYVDKQIQEYTDKILDIQRKRLTREAQ